MTEAAILEIDRRRRRARSLTEAGDVVQAIEAWRDVLQLYSNDRRSHKHLAILLPSLGRFAEAEPHLRWMTARQPDAGWVWRSLAQSLEQMGDVDGAIDAWKRAIACGEDDDAARLSLARLLESKLPELRALVDQSPQTARLWMSLGLALEKAGETDEAIAAFDRVTALSPDILAAHEHRDRLVHAAQRGPASLKIMVFGNCQALGVAQSLRRLLPDADVVGIVAPFRWSPDMIVEAERLATYDVVIGQRYNVPDHPFGQKRMADLGERFVAFPRFLFSGFHPDAMKAPDLDRMKPFKTVHSRLIASAYVKGVPRDRVADLFNAYVYGVLGYFDEFEKAERFLLQSSPDLDLSGVLADWKTQVFAHIPNHPTIEVLHSIARLVCEKVGLPTIPAEPPPDPQALRVVWPVYPEIGRRLGVEGSLSFRPGGHHPPLDLEQTIARHYQHYANGSSILDSPPVVETAAILAREGV